MLLVAYQIQEIAVSLPGYRIHGEYTGGSSEDLPDILKSYTKII